MGVVVDNWGEDYGLVLTWELLGYAADHLARIELLVLLMLTVIAHHCQLQFLVRFPLVVVVVVVVTSVTEQRSRNRRPITKGSLPFFSLIVLLRLDCSLKVFSLRVSLRRRRRVPSDGFLDGKIKVEAEDERKESQDEDGSVGEQPVGRVRDKGGQKVESLNQHRSEVVGCLSPCVLHPSVGLSDQHDDSQSEEHQQKDNVPVVESLEGESGKQQSEEGAFEDQHKVNCTLTLGEEGRILTEASTVFHCEETVDQQQTKEEGSHRQTHTIEGIERLRKEEELEHHAGKTKVGREQQSVVDKLYEQSADPPL